MKLAGRKDEIEMLETIMKSDSSEFNALTVNNLTLSNAGSDATEPTFTLVLKWTNGIMV